MAMADQRHPEQPERQETRTPAEIGPDRDDASLGHVREGALEPDREQTRPGRASEDPDPREDLDQAAEDLGTP